MSYDLPQQTPTINTDPSQSGNPSPSLTPPPAPVIDTFTPSQPAATPLQIPKDDLVPPPTPPKPADTPAPAPTMFARPITPLATPPFGDNQSASAIPSNPSSDTPTLASDIDPTTPEEVEKLTNQLLDDLGLSDLEGKDKEDVLEAIRERVNNTILLTLLENISDQDADELEEKLKAGASDEEALEYLAGKATNYTDKFATKLAELYNELKETVK